MGSDQKQLLNRISVCDFVMVELALYLDTHPTEEKALDMYNRYRDMKRAASDEYAEKYGPLKQEQNTSTTYWSWTDAPWPWERREA